MIQISKQTKILLLLFIEQNDPILYLSEAKVCEHHRLAGDLKVDLESGGFSQRDDKSSIFISLSTFNHEMVYSTGQKF